jgi:hypothetical protein
VRPAGKRPTPARPDAKHPTATPTGGAGPRPEPLAASAEIPESDIAALWKQSQFKRLYNLKDGRILSVRIAHNDAETDQEFSALQKVKGSGLKTPDPELVTYQGHKAIRMNKVEGTFVDINKFSETMIYKLMVLTITKGHMDLNEESSSIVLKMQGIDQRKAQPEIVANLRAELARIMEASKKVLINDFQVIIDRESNLTVIDPTWAGDASAVRADAGMILAAYQRVTTRFSKLGE